MNQLWVFMQESIEKLYYDVAQVQKIAIMTCLVHEKITKEFEKVAQELDAVVKTRVEFNKNHKKKLRKD